MSKSSKQILILLIISLSFASCKTYYIPLESFKQQFGHLDTADRKPVVTVGGGIIYTRERYVANPASHIKCIDKNDNPHMLDNGPAIEIRFTWSDHGKTRRTVFYFDRMFVTDSTVVGVRSRYLGIRKTIPLDSIRKIEVQNGGKNYHYVQ